MKIKDIFADAVTVAGCCVGAGFLSGKEAQLYYGNTACVCVFAAFFCLLTLCVRAFCSKNGCYDVNSLCKTCYPAFGGILSTLTCACCFVCIVAMIAGANSCLSSLLFAGFEPFYGIIVGAIAVAVVKIGLRALKALNALSLVLAAAYLVWLTCEIETPDFTPQTTSPFLPFIYATFSATMSLGVLTKLAKTDGKSNVAATITASVLLLALALCVLHLCDFRLDLPLLCRTNNTALNVLGGVSIVCATVTGVCANAIPVLECVRDVFDGDDTLCLLVVFCVAVALSLLGVDVVMKWGYLLVAGVGAAIVFGCIKKTLHDKLPDKKFATKRKAKNNGEQ